MPLSHREIPPPASTVRGLLHQLLTQLSSLMRQELTLARTALGQSLTRLLSSMRVIVGAMALLYTSLLLLLTAALFGLAMLMPIWLAALGLGVVIGALGLLLLERGRRLLKDAHLAPSHLPSSLRQDKEVLLRRTHL